MGVKARTCVRIAVWLDFFLEFSLMFNSKILLHELFSKAAMVFLANYVSEFEHLVFHGGNEEDDFFETFGVCGNLFLLLISYYFLLTKILSTFASLSKVLSSRKCCVLTQERRVSAQAKPIWYKVLKN
jgi:hypothetical protein